MKILFLTLFTDNGASSRVRVYQYLPFLKREGIEYKVIPIIPDKLSDMWKNKTDYPFIYRTLYAFIHNRLLRYLKYLYVIINAPKYDVIFIQKIVLDVILFKLLVMRNKNIIFDFDDNILNPSENNLSSRLRLFYNQRKVSYTFKNSRIVLAGNDYLKECCKNYSSNIIVFPTLVNLDLFPYRDKTPDTYKLVIGWVGMGEYHIPFLRLLVPPLLELQKKYKIKFKLIGARGIQEITDMLSEIEDCEIIDWVKPSEIAEEISTMDICVMPLIEGFAGAGKCGLKILEYMAVGVPVVCSPVGVNKDIVINGENGFWADNEREWIEKLSKLIEDKNLRENFSIKGRLTIEKKYSCQKRFPDWLEFFYQLRRRG